MMEEQAKWHHEEAIRETEGGTFHITIGLVSSVSQDQEKDEEKFKGHNNHTQYSLLG